MGYGILNIAPQLLEFKRNRNLCEFIALFVNYVFQIAYN